MDREELHQHLQNCELFNTLSDAEIAEIEPHCTIKSYNEGELIHRQGDRVDFLCVLLEGSVALVRRAKGEVGTPGVEATVDILSPGRVFGWSSLVRPHVATNTPRVLRRAQSIVIDAAALRFLLEKNRSIGLEVMRRLGELLASRLQAVYSVLDSKI